MKRCMAIGLALLLVGLVGCKRQTGAASSTGVSEEVWADENRAGVQSEELQFQPPTAGSLFVTLETSKGAIRAVLYPEYAPAAVQNFCGLAEQGYYDETLFHRVVKSFVIQAGDATGTGTGGESIWGKPFVGEYTDKLHHYSGALCVAKAAGEPRGNLSQFYIVATPAGGLEDEALEKMRAAGLREAVVDTYSQAGGLPYLDYTATVFGQVVEGMDVVDKIARVQVDDEDRPKSDVRLLSVSVQRPDAAASASPPAEGVA